jgi:hypothetical protein
MEGFEGSQGWLDKKKIHETLKSEKGIFMSEIYSTLFMIKVKIPVVNIMQVYIGSCKEKLRTVCARHCS